MRLIITILLDPASEKLKFNGKSPLSPSLLAALASRLQQGLCEIDFSENNVTDEFIDALSLSSAASTLTKLRCSSATFTDASSGAWSRFISLMDVSISENDFITLQTLDAICALPQLTRIQFETSFIPNFDAFFSILRSSSVRKIILSLDHDDAIAIGKFWKLLRVWEAREKLELFDTSYARGEMISERHVREFKSICPQAALEGLIWEEDKQTAPTEDSDILRSATPLATLLQEGSAVSFKSGTIEEFPQIIAVSPALQTLRIRCAGFLSTLDRANFIASISCAKSLKQLRIILSNEGEGLLATEILQLFQALPLLSNFSASLHRSVSEIVIIHNNLTSVPTFDKKNPDCVVRLRWMPKLAAFYPGQVSELPPVAALPGLRQLSIGPVEEDILGPYLGQLRKISLQQDFAAWPRSAPGFCRLQSIQIFNTSMDDASLRRMLDSCPLLTELQITNRPGGLADVFAQPTWTIQSFDWLKHKHLKRIYIAYCAISQENYTLELSDAMLPSLTIFDLQWTRGINNIYVHDMAQLSYLSFQRVTGDEQSFRIERCPHLTAVTLLSREEGHELKQLIVQDNPYLISFFNLGYSAADAQEREGMVQIQPLRLYESPIPAEEIEKYKDDDGEELSEIITDEDSSASPEEEN